MDQMIMCNMTVAHLCEIMKKNFDLDSFGDLQ